MSECKKNYRGQSCCANCGGVFRYREHDSGPMYFCNSDNSERPSCGSVLMGEWDCDDSDEVAELKYEKWDAWSDPRRVESFGICDSYVKRVDDVKPSSSSIESLQMDAAKAAAEDEARAAWEG